MRTEEKDNYLSVLDKKVINAIKEAAWEQVSGLIAELHGQLASAKPSRSDLNWQPLASAPSLVAAEPEKHLALAVAEGYGGDGWIGALPTSAGLLGGTEARRIDLLRHDGQHLDFYSFKVNYNGEDICKALRDLIVHTACYRAFCESPRQFGYSTEKSPLPVGESTLSWELVAPKDMINPRRSEMCWGERDTQAMRDIMASLGVASFSLGRLQAESEALKNHIAKSDFSAKKARQWFENRVTVVVA